MVEQTEGSLITEEMTVEEIVRRYPQTFRVLLEFGLTCGACRISMFHSLGESATTYGVDVKELLRMLNEIVSA